MTKGRTYVLSAWCRTDGGAKARLSAGMTGSSGAVTAYGQEETSEGEWKRVSLTFTLPSNASSASVTVRLHAAGSAGTVWFDGAQLEEGVTAGRQKAEPMFFLRGAAQTAGQKPGSAPE